MTRKRPVAMLVFGILNLILGTISLGGSSCCGLGAGVSYFGLQAAQKEGNAQLNPDEKAQLELLNELWTTISQNVPGVEAFMVGSLAAGIVLAFLQVLSGVGMVIIRSWGRWLCAFWAFLAIVSALAWLFYWLTVFTPGINKAAPELERVGKKIEEQQQRMKKAPGPGQDFRALGDTGDVVANNLPIIVFVAICASYAGLAFLFMILPGTGEGIARYRGAPGYYPQGGSEDLYDDDYMRRRRGSGQPPEGAGPPGM